MLRPAAGSIARSVSGESVMDVLTLMLPSHSSSTCAAPDPQPRLETLHLSPHVVAFLMPRFQVLHGCQDAVNRGSEAKLDLSCVIDQFGASFGDPFRDGRQLGRQVGAG